jgi:hypothetical protein
MSKRILKKEKWTLNVDSRVKGVVIKEAKKLGIYPVEFIESLVREKFNPFGHSDVKDEGAYVHTLRGEDKHKTDRKFLEEIRRWENINS